MKWNTNQHLQSPLTVKTCTWEHHIDSRRQCTWFFWQRLSAWIWSSQLNHYAANAWTVAFFLVWHVTPMFHPHWPHCWESCHLSLHTARGMSMLRPDVLFYVHLLAALAPILHTLSENQTTGRWFCAAMSETSGGELTWVPKLWNTGSAKLLVTHFPSVLASPGTASHYGLRRTRWFGLQRIASTIIWLFCHNLRSIHVAQ